ncbi:UDP-galactose-4-epimerase [Marinomonas ushuaiensis DSM 15871]|uniref:UDP-glucose 4-epimerase n=1 Tax=Marinomonas ushuaiensis DSM 15871 TaxID=1122207 RepID=X7E9H3_9GAMM|nr:UDP-glucose 4-epimerase GalE [Marinomonas ushuaiensis]ETX12592.1 UDP-galactose-4-epimerase [Marinomonas ushuaiensis DSM 15871]
MFVLVTGGTGYIGSHTCIELIKAGFDPVIIDNLLNSNEVVLERIETVTGKRPIFIKGDVLDSDFLNGVFDKYSFSAVMHFAGLKAVGESVQKPFLYYENNVSGSLNLIKAMERVGLHNLIFSSSATVYGLPKSVPIREDFATSTSNPYGASKLMVEDILTDLVKANDQWNIATLRYFNPIGAHESGLIGEDPKGIPNNLFPYISQVAVGKLEYLSVFGDDYDTPDGTGVRDYIHVVDLAKGHVCALRKVLENSGHLVVNLGTGNGYSVLEMVRAFETVSGKAVPFKIIERRPGDIGACYSETRLAKEVLGWEAKFDLSRMCEDTWRWQSNNPNGFE